MLLLINKPLRQLMQLHHLLLQILLKKDFIIKQQPGRKMILAADDDHGIVFDQRRQCRVRVRDLRVIDDDHPQVFARNRGDRLVLPFQDQLPQPQRQVGWLA